MQEALQCYGQVLLLPSAATDFSVTNNGWRFTYTYQGTSTGRSGLPKPEGRQDIALPIVAGASWAFLHREDALQPHREQRLPRFGDPGPGTQHRA